MQPIKSTAAKGLYQLATAGFSESLLLIFGSLAWRWSKFRTVKCLNKGGNWEKTKTKKTHRVFPLSSGLQTYPKPPQIPPEASDKKTSRSVGDWTQISQRKKPQQKKHRNLGHPLDFFGQSYVVVASVLRFGITLRQIHFQLGVHLRTTRSFHQWS